jgi:CheY-like chemotaxis protein
MSRKKILCVDDSPTSIMWQRMILSEEPYDIVVAEDGAAGVEKAIAEKPDLILLDAMMPKMNGYEACRAIRSKLALRRVPVIMLTTRSEPESVEEGKRSGCTDYLTKPIDKVALLAKIRTYLAA